MKKISLAPALILVGVAIAAASGFITINKNHTIATEKNGFSVLELFTSEGCSSCPAADKAVANILSKNTKNVYILSYHVDYWNRLGWKDVFSKAEFSARQQKYAAHFSSEGVYTPQVIVNGTTEFVGSDESKINNTIAGSLQKDAGSDVSISTSKKSNTITISFDIKEQDRVLLNIALVQPEATTDVKRGENGGRMLHHVNIVREFKTVDAAGKGNITIEIPKELSGMALELIAFTQQKNSLKILGADKKIVGA